LYSAYLLYFRIAKLQDKQKEAAVLKKDVVNLKESDLQPKTKAGTKSESLEDLITNMIRRTEWKYLTKNDCAKIKSNVNTVVHNVCTIIFREFTANAATKTSLFRGDEFSDYYKNEVVMAEMEEVYDPQLLHNMEDLGNALYNSNKRSYLKKINFINDPIRYGFYTFVAKAVKHNEKQNNEPKAKRNTKSTKQISKESVTVVHPPDEFQSAAEEDSEVQAKAAYLNLHGLKETLYTVIKDYKVGVTIQTTDKIVDIVTIFSNEMKEQSKPVNNTRSKPKYAVDAANFKTKMTFNFDTIVEKVDISWNYCATHLNQSGLNSLQWYFQLYQSIIGENIIVKEKDIIKNKELKNFLNKIDVTIEKYKGCLREQDYKYVKDHLESVQNYFNNVNPVDNSLTLNVHWDDKMNANFYFSHHFALLYLIAMATMKDFYSDKYLLIFYQTGKSDKIEDPIICRNLIFSYTDYMGFQELLKVIDIEKADIKFYCSMLLFPKVKGYMALPIVSAEKR